MQGASKKANMEEMGAVLPC